MQLDFKLRIKLFTMSYIQAARCLDVMATDILSQNEQLKASLHHRLKRVEDLRNWHRRTLIKHRIDVHNNKLKQKYDIKEG